MFILQTPLLQDDKALIKLINFITTNKIFMNQLLLLVSTISI